MNNTDTLEMRVRRRRIKSSLDVGLAPFVDVVFLLLCFFVVTTRFNDFHSISIDLPETLADSPMADMNFIEMTIDKFGTIFVGNVELADTSNATIAPILQEYPKDRPLLIRADKNTRHGDVIRIMDLAIQVGFASINIATTTSIEIN